MHIYAICMIHLKITWYENSFDANYVVRLSQADQFQNTIQCMHIYELCMIHLCWTTGPLPASADDCRPLNRLWCWVLPLMITLTLTVLLGALSLGDHRLLAAKPLPWGGQPCFQLPVSKQPVGLITSSCATSSPLIPL